MEAGGSATETHTSATRTSQESTSIPTLRYAAASLVMEAAADDTAATATPDVLYSCMSSGGGSRSYSRGTSATASLLRASTQPSPEASPSPSVVRGQNHSPLRTTPSPIHSSINAAAASSARRSPQRISSAAATPTAQMATTAAAATSATTAINAVPWSTSIRQRLFDRVFTPNASPWMSFSSALGWEANDRWSFSEDEEGERDALRGGSDAREDSGGARERREAATAVAGDERRPLLGSYGLSSPSGIGGGASASPSRVQQSERPAQRSCLRRLRRHIRRHAGWHLFLAAFISLQLSAVLVVLGGVVALRTAYPDVLLHLRPWGIASCACGVGIATVSIALVFSLRKRALLSAMAAVAVLFCLLVVLVILCAGAAWFTWIAWEADARRGLPLVTAAWEAATAETYRRAAAGEATDTSPICLFQSAHACSGFRYGCCNAAECFDASSTSASSLPGSGVGDAVPEWVRVVCPICRDGDAAAAAAAAAAVSGSDSGWSVYNGAPVMCTMALLPLLLRTVAPYAILNGVALCVAVGAVVWARLLHRAVKQRRGSVAGSAGRSEWRSP